jgi:hypothetical protein
MERIEKTVFLSYRRTSFPWALAIFQNLTGHGYDVVFDYEGISSLDFESVVLENIKARAHFLLLLTPSALEDCDQPEDWFRREIETALSTQRNIVPLMLEGFDFGTPKIASQLTGKLAALKHYKGLSIPKKYFLEAMAKLHAKYLNVPLASALHPASSFAKQAAAEQKQAAGAAPAVHFNSCFISFSTKDEEFADLLYGDLTKNGVDCWFSSHNMRSGEKIHEQIDRAILLMDRLLLILSEHSIQSSWVETEIAKARKRELSEKRRMLFPLRLVDFETLRAWKCFDPDTGMDSAQEIRAYFIPDFSDWKQPPAYKKALNRLLRDLEQTS